MDALPKRFDYKSAEHKGQLEKPTLKIKDISNLSDDEDLMQSITDKDYEGRDKDYNVIQKASTAAQPSQRHIHQSATLHRRQLSTSRTLQNDTNSESDTNSDDSGKVKLRNVIGVSSGKASTTDVQINITPEMWELLSVDQEIKELFPYILKYTPQNIETFYHLQPFVPDYVPAVGDVDGFLKVTVPPLLQTQRLLEINEHFLKIGLHFLDEPSGDQSEPNLLNMKLRRLLGNGIDLRSPFASIIPTVQTPRDIDKWISEVEQMHMTQSVCDPQLRIDIEYLLSDWPRKYSSSVTKNSTKEAFRQCSQGEISSSKYIGLLCQAFDINGSSEAQVDQILNIQALFAMHLAASQAWE